jgi:ubiquinone/menaquinone biosynthesis C-methylase UbiE
MNDIQLDITPNHHSGKGPSSPLIDLLSGLTMTVGRQASAELAANLTRLATDDRVLDIGCGPGIAVRWAAKTAAAVSGVDASPTMCRLGRTFTHHSSAQTSFVVGRAEDLPRPDSSATVAWAISSVHHWNDLAQALAEITRVLEPGGRFAALERHVGPGTRDHAGHGWSPIQAATFAELLGAQGFADTRVQHHRLRRRTWTSVTTTRP